MSILELVLLFVVVVILVIIAVLNAISASRLTGIKGYDTDPTLRRAHSYLAWSSVLGWIGLFILVGVMAYYFSRSSEVKIYGYTGARIMLFIATVLIFITGVLSAAAATEMDKVTGANKQTLDESGARGFANWAAILGIVGSVLVIVALVVSFYRSRRSKTKEVELKEMNDEKEKVE